MKTQIISQLSSKCGDTSCESNKRVAEQCVKEPKLLEQIAENLFSIEPRLAADCAEVMTETAKIKPELVAPYANQIIQLLHHKHTFARFESMHSLTFIAHLVPQIVYTILPDLDDILHKDKSVIVRDYATETIVRYAGTGKSAAKNAYPYLLKILNTWGDKHAGRALIGLINVYTALPKLKNQIKPIAESYMMSKRGVVKKSAMKLLHAIEDD